MSTNSKHTFNDLINVMAKLRAPEGCPWDREQTYESILKCLVEEAYEYIDAVMDKEYSNMKEELGDILLQVIFHSQMAKEEKKFDIHDVIHVLTEKLIRRHPHVFGDEEINTSGEVKKKWDQIKAEEKKERTSILDGIPRDLPPILKAEKIQKKVRKVGFEWPDEKGPLAKIREEIGELEEEVSAAKSSGNNEKISEELGDVLFSIVNLSRHLKVDASEALERTNRKFEGRFRELEKRVTSDGKSLEKLGLQALDLYWEQIKTDNRGS